MSAPIAKVRQTISVRGPFRILAGLIVVAALIVFTGLAYTSWLRGTSSLDVRTVVAIPGMLWLLRLAAYSAVYGTPPRQEHWPFATTRVATGYFIIIVLVHYF